MIDGTILPCVWIGNDRLSGRNKRTLGLNTMEGLRVAVLRRFRLASPDPMQNAGENSTVRCTGSIVL